MALTQAQLDERISCSLKAPELLVVILGGIRFRDRVILVALGINAPGTKPVLGLREGSSEFTEAVRSLLSYLISLIAGQKPAAPGEK